MINKENNFISAVIYLQKDETNIDRFLNMLYSVLEANFKKYEIICVSNYFDERTIKQLKQFKDIYEKVNISFIRLDKNQGLEECMNAGIDLAIGDFVFEFDSCYIDYDPHIILDVYKKLLEGYDVVSATPSQTTSKISSRVFYGIYNYFSNTKKITTERFRIISRRALNRVSGYNKNIPYRKAVYASVGLSTFHLNYTLTDRASGIVQNDIQKKNVALDSLILFTNIAYKVSFAFSIIMAFFMFGTGVYTVAVYFSAQKPVEGWAPIMGLISAGFSAMFFILTILIKYMDLILRFVFKKQKYTVVNIEKL